MDFAEFIAPLPVGQFMTEYFGVRPLHLKDDSNAGKARQGVLSSSRLSELLGAPSHWTADTLKLIMNSRPVEGGHYLSELRTESGPAMRADASKMQIFLAMGASLVANRLEDVSPEVRQVASMLGEQFAAAAGANAYCSSQGIQAFNSHCDLHEVFAVQIEGEKSWRIYENRADSPVEALDGPDAQALIDSTKGKVMMTVDMRPGDLLYIPRGYFHDALASSGASLHLTFAVAPLNGRALFRLLEDVAIHDPDFRAYLPDARASGGAALRARLNQLAEKFATVVRSPLVEAELAAKQRMLRPSADALDLTRRDKLDYFARTARPAEVVWHLDGARLRHADGEEPLGILREAAEWAIAQPAFSRQQLASRFNGLTRDEVRALVELLTNTALFSRYEPTLQ